MEELENSMLVDWFWDETEYGVPDRNRLRRQRETYDEIERNGMDGFEEEYRGAFEGDW